MRQAALRKDAGSFGLQRGRDRGAMDRRPVPRRRRPITLAAVIAMLCLALFAAAWAFQWVGPAVLPVEPEQAVAFALSEMRGEIFDAGIASPAAFAARDTAVPDAAPAVTATAPAPIPAHPLRTALVFLHVVGLVVGMGTALFLDAYLLARLYHRPIEAHTADLVTFGTSVVSMGLAILWISGLGLLTFYWFQAPQALGNPKIWAKVTVVLALTLNGMVLHRVVVPRVASRIGQPLLSGETLRRALLPLGAGVVSGVSWAFACTLGLVKEMNYCCPAPLLLGCYGAALVLGFAVAILLHKMLCAAQDRQAAPASDQPVLGARTSRAGGLASQGRMAPQDRMAPQGGMSLLMLAP